MQYYQTNYNMQRLAEKRFCSRMGWGLLLMMGISSFLGSIILVFVTFLAPDLASSPWFSTLAISFCMYIIAMPIASLLFQKVPQNPPDQHKLSARQLVLAFIICYGLSLVGSLIGTIINSAIQAFSGLPAFDLDAVLADIPWWVNLITVVLMAPIFEEWFFRKLLIDRLRFYGEKTALIVSGLLFGLFHGNFSQAFYATLLGFAFGYIYLKTGRLRYTIILHAAFNLLGGFISPLLLQAALPELFFTIYSYILLGFSIAGIILVCYYRKRLWLAPSSFPGSQDFVLGNPGMIVFLVFCFLQFAFSIFGSSIM